MAGPIVGLLAVTLGCPISSVAIGVLSFVWLARVKETPRQDPTATPEELREIEGDRVVEEAGRSAVQARSAEVLLAHSLLMLRAASVQITPESR